MKKLDWCLFSHRTYSLWADRELFIFMSVHKYIMCPYLFSSICYVLPVYTSVSPSAVWLADHNSLAASRSDLAEFVSLVH